MKNVQFNHVFGMNNVWQVGKTYALKTFGEQHYAHVAYFNFEKDERLADFFESTLDPKELIKILSIHAETAIEPERTLIIFDESQGRRPYSELSIVHAILWPCFQYLAQS